jgi:hypothetical protein
MEIMSKSDLSKECRLVHIVLISLRENKMPEYDIKQLRIGALFGGHKISDEHQNYGKEVRFRREDATCVECRGIEYLFTSTDAWTAGVGKIRVDRGYRIFSRDLDGYGAREVLDIRELENVAIGIMDRIDAILKEKKDKGEKK